MIAAFYDPIRRGGFVVQLLLALQPITAGHPLCFPGSGHGGNPRASSLASLSTS